MASFNNFVLLMQNGTGEWGQHHPALCLDDDDESSRMTQICQAGDGR